MRRGECTRRALIAGSLFVGACATSDRYDPIVGRWRGESVDLVFMRDGRVRVDPIPSEEDDSSIDYVFPRISWRKNGSTYRVFYIWPRFLRRPAEERQAQLHNGELVVTAQDEVLRYRRVA